MANTYKNEKESEGLFKQNGIISSTISETGNSINATIKVDYEEIGNVKLYCSGSLKNTGSTTAIVRLQSVEFTNGFANVNLNAGEVLKFKNIRLDSVSAPAVTGQASSVSIKFVAITYSVSYGQPEITFT